MSEKASAAPTKPAAVVPAARPLCLMFRNTDAKLRDKDKHPPATGLFVVWGPVAPALGPVQAKDGTKEDPAFEHDVSGLGAAALQVGFVDEWGYVQTVSPGHNAWADLGPQKGVTEGQRKGVAQTHCQKAVVGQAYRLWFVAHPSSEAAFALKDTLRNKKAVGAFSFRGCKHVDWVAIAEEHNKLVICPVYLPTSPEFFGPPGAKLFGGWLLYKSMPHGCLPQVKSEVRRAAQMLGQLGFACHDAPNDAYSQSGAARGVFGDALAGATLRFQELLQERAAFNLAFRKWPLNTVAESFERLVGCPVALTKGAAPAVAPGATAGTVRYLPRVDQVTAATIDETTALAIEEWTKLGLRQPGAQLVMFHPPNRPGAFDTAIWMRPEVRFAFMGWELLTVALGCPIKPMVGNSWRPFNSNPTEGRSKFSNHSGGTAFDLAANIDEDYRDSLTSRSDRYPVLFEAQWEKNQVRDAKAAAGQKATLQAQVAKRRAENKVQKAEAKVVELEKRLLTATQAARPAVEKQLQQAQAALQVANAQRDAAAEALEEKEREEKAHADKRAAALAAADSDEWKTSYTLRFGVYGHCTLDVFSLAQRNELAATIDGLLRGKDAAASGAASNVAGNDSQAEASEDDESTPEEEEAEAGEVVEDDVEDRRASNAPGRAAESIESTGGTLVETYRAALVKFIPSKPKTMDEATWLLQTKDLSDKIEGAVARFSAAVQSLLKDSQDTTPEGQNALVAKYFRKAIKPFAADSWQKDGGDSLPEVSAIEDAKTAEVQAKYPALASTAKCWLNLSRVAYHLGLHRISARAGEARLHFDSPYYSKGAGKESKQRTALKIEGDLTLKHKKGAPAPDPEKIDPYRDNTRRGSLRRLVEALKRLEQVGLSHVPWVLHLKDKTVEVPQSDFIREALWAWPPVPLTGKEPVPPGIAFDGLTLVWTVSGDEKVRKQQAAAVATALKLAELEVESLGEEIPSDRIPQGDVLSQESLDKVIPRSNLEGARKSRSKSDQGRVIRLHPVLVRVPVGEPLSKLRLQMGLRIDVPAPGTPLAFEWWHYDFRLAANYANLHPWVEQMEDLGISAKWLSAPSHPASDLKGLLLPGGNFESDKGDFLPQSEPSNGTVIPAGG